MNGSLIFRFLWAFLLALSYEVWAYTNTRFLHTVSVSTVSAGTHKRSSSFSLQAAGPTLHGSQQTRSPLINWFLLEKRIPFVQKKPKPSPHPFGQVPCLVDKDGVEVFESGAILLYLADMYGGTLSTTTSSDAADRAKYSKWVVWSNSELDGLCFGKGMSGTQLDKPSKPLDTLESILESTDYIVDNAFSVADVAVASYLNYVPVFFRNVAPTNRPNVCQYMLRCAERPAFAEAFGPDHAQLVINQAKSWLGNSANGKDEEKPKKMFGVF